MRLKQLFIALWAIVLLFPLWGNAQNPCFNFVGDSVGCAPYTVSIQSCVQGGITTFYFPAFGVSQRIKNASTGGADTFTYNQPGIYELRQGIAVNGQNFFISRTVVVLGNQQPRYVARPCDDSSVAITLQSTLGDRFVVKFNDKDSIVTAPVKLTPLLLSFRYRNQRTNPRISIQSFYRCAAPKDTSLALINRFVNPTPIKASFTLRQKRTAIEWTSNLSNYLDPEFFRVNPITTLPEKLTHTRTAPNSFLVELGPALQDSAACIRIRLFDACRALIDTHTICHTGLKAEAQQNQIRLRWKPFIPPFGIVGTTVINRDANFLRRVTISLPEFFDTTVRCGPAYCYEVVTTHIGTPPRPGLLRGSPELISQSIDTCLKAISERAPKAPENLFATIKSGGKVWLSWNPPANASVNRYSLRRINPVTNLFTDLPNQEIDTLLDGSVQFPENYFCYQVGFTDSCGNASAKTARFCPIRLTVAPFVDRKELEWSPIIGWPTTINPTYTLEFLDRSGKAYKSYEMGENLNYPDNEDHPEVNLIRYRIRANANLTGVLPSYSNVVEVVNSEGLLVPTAFSPNNDGHNDVYKVYAAPVREFEMLIFNRWGQLLYQTNNQYQGWDGKFQGKECENGTYVAVIKALDDLGRNLEQRVNLALIR